MGRPIPRSILRFALLAAIPLGGVAAAWYFLLPTPRIDNNSTESEYPDPRLTYTGPYRNIHPSVTTVGSEKCAECHSDVAKVYSHHPMGQSILPISNQPIGDLVGKGQVEFSALGSRFHVERARNQLWYTETRTGADGSVLYRTTTQINHVIGSGTKGHSFLSERDGYVNQDAVSWFTQKHLWDESPGFSQELHAGRAVQAGCLFCHANEVVPVPGSVNKYELPLFRNGSAIGCERCHGPGSEHVRLRESGAVINGPDYSIVNPKDLDAPLREAVCQQCHLAGEARVVRAGRKASDYRPGLPLDAVLRVLVLDHHGEDRKAVNHVEQMYLSKCYTGSGGKLGCTTCHNPHEKAPIEKRQERYHAACLKCHECAEPIAARAKQGAPDNCTSCHMPKFSATDIVHAATTNHRIIRKRESTKSENHPPGPRKLLFFPDRQPDLQNPSEGGDFALGLIEMAKHGKAPMGEVSRDALPLLERAIADSSNDVRIWEAKSHVLELAGRKSEALAATRTLLSLVPDHEIGLTRAAALSFKPEQPQETIDYWRRAIGVNPTNANYRQELASILARSGNWKSAVLEAQAAIQLDPASATARTILAISESQAGNTTKADEQMRVVEQLQPPNLGQLRKWYASERAKK